VLVDRGVATGGGVRREIWDHDELVGRYLDVGLVPKVGGSRWVPSFCQHKREYRTRAVKYSCGRVIVRASNRAVYVCDTLTRLS
jgi:hypothetical protein